MFLKSSFVYSNSKSSYSNLLNELDSGNIKSLFLYPKRREVDVIYKNGLKEKIPIFYNDQIIIEKAADNKVELTINNSRKDSINANNTATFFSVYEQFLYHSQHQSSTEQNYVLTLDHFVQW